MNYHVVKVLFIPLEHFYEGENLLTENEEEVIC